MGCNSSNEPKEGDSNQAWLLGPNWRQENMKRQDTVDRTSSHKVVNKSTEEQIEEAEPRKAQKEQVEEAAPRKAQKEQVEEATLKPGTASPAKKGAVDRVERYIEAAAALSESSAPQLAEFLRVAGPVISMFLHCLVVIGYGYVQLYEQAYVLYCQLPLNVMQMVIGLTLCLFGGTYVALIAAVEAFHTMGGKKLFKDLQFVMEQMQAVYEANVADDKLDLDNDGVADVDQITAQELTQRKLRVSMLAVEAPEKLQAAVGALWAACLAVLATLKFEFAQITAYALAIAGMLKFPFVRAFAPTLTWALGKELLHWVDPILDSILKIVCIMLVWYLAKIRAAFYSGIRGGQIFAEALLRFCDERGWMDRLPGYLTTKPFDPALSYLDEAVGLPLAALGIYFQLSLWFSLPFPLDWILWPVSMAETWLEFQISW